MIQSTLGKDDGEGLTVIHFLVSAHIVIHV